MGDDTPQLSASSAGMETIPSHRLSGDISQM
jgi:hypothetical protein